MHKILDEYEFPIDTTIDYKLNCPWALQVTRNCIKSWINSNFCRIRTLTAELAVLECLKYPIDL